MQHCTGWAKPLLASSHSQALKKKAMRTADQDGLRTTGQGAGAISVDEVVGKESPEEVTRAEPGMLDQEVTPPKTATAVWKGEQNVSPRGDNRRKAPRGAWVWCGQEGPGGWSRGPTGAGAVVGRAAGRLRRGSGRLEEEPPAVSGRGQGDPFPLWKVGSGGCGAGAGEWGERRRQEAPQSPSWEAFSSPEGKRGGLTLMLSFSKAVLTTLALLVPFRSTAEALTALSGARTRSQKWTQIGICNLTVTMASRKYFHIH